MSRQTLLERKLDSVLLMEMPYVLWVDKPKEETLTIPGTDKSFHTMIDLRLERWAPEVYRDVFRALSRDGIVGQTNSGQWVYFRVNEKTDPTMRAAGQEEVDALTQLPDGWEDNINLDGVGE